MKALKWTSVVVLALLAGLILGTVSVFLSLLVGSWIPALVAYGLAMGVLGFAVSRR